MAVDQDAVEMFQPQIDELKREIADLKTGDSASYIAANLALFNALRTANDQDAVWDKITAALE